MTINRASKDRNKASKEAKKKPLKGMGEKEGGFHLDWR